MAAINYAILVDKQVLEMAQDITDEQLEMDIINTDKEERAYDMICLGFTMLSEMPEVETKKHLTDYADVWRKRQVRAKEFLTHLQRLKKLRSEHAGTNA